MEPVQAVNTACIFNFVHSKISRTDTKLKPHQTYHTAVLS